MADIAKDLFKLIMGLLIILVGVWLIAIWAPDVWFLIKIVFKGSIGIAVALIGLVILLISASALKS